VKETIVQDIGKIIEGLPYEDYDAIDAWRPSVIVEGRQSMLHVWSARYEKEQKESESLLFGQAVHVAAFEPEEFEFRVEEADGTRTAAKKRDAKERGVILLKPDHKQFGYYYAVQAAKRIFDYQPLKPFIAAGGSREVSMFTEECGLQVKFRMDYLSNLPAILDLKTARSIAERPFSRAFYDYGYDLKLGLYQRWAKRLLGISELPVYTLLVENGPPFDVTMIPRVKGEPIPLPQPVLDRGVEKGLAILKKIGECIKSGVWPGIDGEPDWTLQTPVWEMDEESPDEVRFDETE
jgi:hypothetical protein